MKSLHQMKAGRARVSRRVAGFTITEMLCGVALFSLIIMGTLTVHLFGLRENQLVESKLGASDQSRRAFGKLLTDIRGAKMLAVGNGTASSFTAIPYGTAQQGTAVQMSPTTDTNYYIRYYYDTNRNELRRRTSDSTTYKVIADHLTNSLIFWAEDYRGTTLVDGTHSYAVRTVLQFYQYQYPLTRVGPGFLYDYYKLEFRATRRAHD